MITKNQVIVSIVLVLVAFILGTSLGNYSGKEENRRLDAKLKANKKAADSLVVVIKQREAVHLQKLKEMEDFDSLLLVERASRIKERAQIKQEKRALEKQLEGLTPTELQQQIIEFYEEAP